jgi:predicted Ser/Thr protein kinase
MPSRPAHPCPHRSTTEALARQDLTGQDREQAERHLERCQACRLHFRQQTAGRFPRIRNYTILSEVGRGGFGVVYKALHHSKERCEALKVLFGKTAQREAYFENEVRLAAKLRHPNIATLYDANLSTAPMYYAMEFVEGQQLDDYFRSHDLSLERRIELVKTVASAIGHAHRQGVIHRDLKPQNILIDDQGQPRIVDFGIAKRLGLDGDSDPQAAGSPRRAEGALGTFGYIAPEQLAGQSVDWRADIYGLGALLFHVITGQPARFAPEVKRLTEVLHERRVSRADDLAAIIACCVDPVPEQRYPTCEALVVDLDNYLTGRPIRARADRSPGYQVARIAALVVRKYQLAAQVAAVLLVAALMTETFWVAGARWLSPGQQIGHTALIALMPSTLEAVRSGQLGSDLPGLSLENRKSYRVLYGRLMERLAQTEPRVVVWDYFFPDCQPEFDAAFVRGVRALKAPVIVGAEGFDLNGEPVLCPEIRAAVRAWGTMSGTEPGAFHGAVHVPLAVQRGLNAPVPSLALAGFAAARHPDCDLDIRVSESGLTLGYRKREVSPGEPRWPHEPGWVPIFKTETAGPQHLGHEPGDRFIFGRFRTETVPEWARYPIPLENVLAADSGQLRRWFDDRVVLIGQTVAPVDQHELKPGELVFGCQLQAMFLDDLLAGTQTYRLSRAGLAIRVCWWCVLAAAAIRLLPTRGTWPLRLVSAVAIAAVGVVLPLTLWLPQVVTEPWAIEATVAGCALAACAAVSLLIKLHHQRQLHLTSGTFWSAVGTSGSTTLLAPAAMKSTTGSVGPLCRT